MIHCSGDGQKDNDCGEDGQGNDEGKSNTVCCELGHGSGVAGYGGGVGFVFVRMRGTDIPSCSSPPNSKTTVQQDGASNPISGNTWFPVVLAIKGRKGCTFVLEDIQWLLSQQAPQACGSRPHGTSEAYLCMLAEKQSKTRFHHQDSRKCGQLSLSTEGGEAKMKGRWLLLMKRHRNCWFKG